jgi:tetratricopeptide (TPR) repeat protein
LNDHPEMHSVASSLAMIEYHLGDFASAERRLELLVDSTGSDWAGDPQLPWIVRNTLARVRMEQGRFAESRALYEESLELCREVNDEGSMNVFGARKDLAGLEWLAGNKALAESMLRDLIAEAEEQIQAANPAALEAVNILGMVLADTQRLDEAQSLFQGMADDLAARLDPGHPSLLVVQGNLACVLERKGELQPAEQLYRELIAVRTELYGRGDAGTLDLLNNLGTCLSGQQRFAEAEEAHRETLDRRRALYGPDNPLSLNAQNNLAFDVFKQGRASEALELQEEVVERTLPDDPNLGGRRIMLEDLRRAVQAEASPAPSASDPR